MIRLVSISIGFFMLLGPVATPLAHAQSPQQRQWCDGERDVSPDQQISGCTAIIESGRDEPSTLATAFNNRAGAYFSQGHSEQAIQDIDQAIKLDPNYAHAFAHRGRVYQSTGRYDRAIQDFDQAIKLKPNYAHAFVERGSVYSHQGQHKRAIQDFDQAIKLNPASGSALNDRCLSHATLGELQEALMDCNNALWLRPGRGRATTLNVRGIVYLKMKQFDSAIADMDAALKLAPHNATSLYERGLAKLKKGDTAGGNSDIRAAKAIQADIENEFARYEVQ